LVDGARISFQELGLVDGVGPVVRFWGWEGLLSLRPGRLLSFWLLVFTWFRSLLDHHHAHDIICCHDVKQQRLTRL
jgi:hypothetical protein